MISVPVGRIVEIANDRRHLSLYRGFMVVTDTESRAAMARVPIDDVAAVIAHAYGLSYTNNLLEALAVRCAPLVVCGSNHNAVAMLVPVEGHGLQAGRFDAQIRASLPMRKRLWAEIVRSKLRHQAAVLGAIAAPTAPITALIPRVRSGDSTNVEAQAAKRYWSLLFGSEFRRDRDADGPNAMLNYGYTVMRSAVARAVIAAGLHPTLGLFHSHQGNAMRLVDDLIEPFRPLVDAEVHRLHRNGALTVNSEVKRALAGILYTDRRASDGTTPLIACINRLATSLAQVYLGERKSLLLPEASALETPQTTSSAVTDDG
jgi:CRISPR-associated protein Cas1